MSEQESTNFLTEPRLHFLRADAEQPAELRRLLELPGELLLVEAGGGLASASDHRAPCHAVWR